MIIKQDLKSRVRLLGSWLLLFAAAGLVVFSNLRGGKNNWNWVIPFLGVIFVADVWVTLVSAKTFVVTKDGVEIRFLFIRLRREWRDLAVECEEYVLPADSSRGKGYLYGTTQSGSSSKIASGNYMSPYVNVNTDGTQKYTKVSFYKKSKRRMKTTAVSQYLHPFSLTRVFLFDGVRPRIFYQYAEKKDFEKKLAEFGVKLPVQKK